MVMMDVNSTLNRLSYVTIVLDAVLPEVSNGELGPDDECGPADHH